MHHWLTKLRASFSTSTECRPAAPRLTAYTAVALALHLAATARDERKEACDAIGAAAGIIGAALILAIVLPIVGCLLVALLVALVVYCCCCKGKKAAAGAPAQPTAVEITKTAV